jgi:hypothetical protein
MALLPNAESAHIDLRKLEDYCLSPGHPRGRHKARVFRDSLGIGQSQAGWLRQQILAALAEADAVELEPDDYGRRWRVDVMVARQNRRAVVRTVWLMRTGESTPRFVTCWVR